MSASLQNSGKKWIQTSVAIVCMILAYILISFFNQMSEWFELESKVPYFHVGAQVLAVIISFSIFLYIMINEKISTFLQDVYSETLKVVWPDKNQTGRHTVGIMIGVSIVGFLLGFFDFAANYILGLIR